MIEISEKQVSVIAQDCIVPVYLTIGGIQQEYRVTQIDSSFDGYCGRRYMAELEKVPMSESVVLPTKVEDKVEIKEPKLKCYKLNSNYTPSAGDHFWVADWNNDEIKELVALTPDGWWYNRECKLERGFADEDFMLFSSGTFGTATEDDIPWGARRIFKSDILSPVYDPENIVVTCDGITLTCGNTNITEIPQTKKEKSELKYTELWMADTSKDMMGATVGYLTNGKVYEILSSSFIQGRQQFEVVCDNGYVYYFHNGWFKPVHLYDEDESELICRDIEFAEGDYIELRKHTPEQIRHIAKFYKFFNVEQLLESNLWSRVYWNEQDGFTGTLRDTYVLNKEYTYDDIFYSEEI